MVASTCSTSMVAYSPASSTGFSSTSQLAYSHTSYSSTSGLSSMGAWRNEAPKFSTKETRQLLPSIIWDWSLIIGPYVVGPWHPRNRYWSISGPIFHNSICISPFKLSLFTSIPITFFTCPQEFTNHHELAHIKVLLDCETAHSIETVCQSFVSVPTR